MALCAIAGARPTRADDMDSLFGDEIREAAEKLNWHGEALADDTVYAIALTGASWEPAWDRGNLFWMGWGDCRKTGGKRRSDAGDREAAEAIHASYADHDYRRVVEIGMSHFSLEQVACDIEMKKEVGDSFLQLGQPERAFPIFASPFKAAGVDADVVAANRRFRVSAQDAAVRAGLRKEAICFALSLLLEPGTEPTQIDVAALRYLEQSGVNVDRVLLGILEAPPRLRGLPNYSYAALDLITLRPNPRLLPLMLELADGSDVYIRSRALLAMGILGFRSRAGDPGGDWSRRIVPIELREYGISAAQRGAIRVAEFKAARQGDWRLRAAAALGLGLVGDEDALPRLKELARDRAYTLSPANADHTRQLAFPVRIAASAALARYGIAVEPGGGDLEPKALNAARRGGQEVTDDRSGLRREIYSVIAISPTDILPPLSIGRR